MYEAFFQLKQRPFAAAPQPERYFPAQSIEAAYHALVRCVDRAEGPGILIGAPGTGKSLLLEMLARRFDGRFTVVMLASGNFSGRRELMQAILYELQMPYRGMDEGELRLALFERLDPNPHCPAGVLLLVDEAHRLPLRLLEELRLLGDYARDGQPRVRLIMAGNRNLEEHLTHPKLDALAQRLAVRSYLSPFERAETAAFVRSQIAAMGGQSDTILTPDALDAMHQATGGIPRLINQLGDHALVLAYAAGRRLIDKNRVEEAWSDLQQLPAPWNDADVESEAAGASVIEFGELDDEDEPEALPFSMQQMMSSEPSPTVKLDQITAQLASLDDDFDLPEPFEPLPSNTNMHSDPFAESFLEEEVVLDRYTLADASLADYPSVSSLEGSLLSSLLEPHMQAGQWPQLAVTDEVADRLHSMVIAASAPQTASQPVDHMCSGACGGGYELKHAVAAAEGIQAGPPNSAQPGNIAMDASDAHEMEMIVVENDPDMPRQAGNTPAARRQEYRQLFAKLRNG
ncbi:MAG TPA: AAA family ATPase [Pirellulales bacterium]|jgi:type II secretory pathway predicted ATPase ExeA|nr:AAA family ATPase [Pirellulales bacterium]